MRQAIISKIFMAGLTSLAVLAPVLLFAQDPGAGPDAVPIDGGLTLLVAAGVGFGVKKIREARKNKLK